MTISRIAAGSIGLALVAGLTFVGATAANAADVPVTLPSIPDETNPYTATWFAGEVIGGTGTAVQGPTGLVITGGALGYQLLNGAPIATPVTLTAALTDARASAVGGAATFQISVFGEPNTAFTTLRPLGGGNWTTSQSVAGLTAEAPYTTAALIAALDADAPAQVLAFGVFVDAGATVTLRAIEFNDNRYLFTGLPTIVASPTEVQLSDLGKPLTLTASGFAPGETVVFGLSTGMSGSELTPRGTAGADGTAVFQFDNLTGYGIGELTFFASDVSGVFGASTTFSIVANTLPATGVELTGVLAGAGVLLTAGAGFLIFSLRRKAAAL